VTTHILDTRGQRCPLPIINLAKFMAGLPEGDSVVITSSDPAAEYDIPAWARMKGRQCSSPEVIRDDMAQFRFLVTFTVTNAPVV
jgi:tRNA 2-thiouridine synthesizing protein A